MMSDDEDTTSKRHFSLKDIKMDDQKERERRGDSNKTKYCYSSSTFIMYLLLMSGMIFSDLRSYGWFFC